MKEIESWQNGKWIPNSKVGVPLWDAHFFFGWAVFEAMRTYNKKIFLMDEHIDRLFRSAELADIPLADKYYPDIIKNYVAVTLKHNKTFFKNDEEIRVMIFASPGNFKIYKDMGTPEVRLTINITTVSRYANHIAPFLEKGFKGVIVSQPQIPSRFLDPKIKSCSRLHYGIADREAARQGERSIPILLDEHGNIAESSGGNIAFFKAGEVCLPHEHDMLRGCTMQYVKIICNMLGYPIKYGNWSPYDIINSDGAIFTSTFYGILPCLTIVYRNKPFKIINDHGYECIEGIVHKFNKLVGVDTWKQWKDWYE